MIISNQNPEQTKKLIRTAKEKPIIVQAQNREYNRQILEYGKFNILLFPSEKKEKNAESDLNHIDAKAAAKNKIKIGYDLEKIRSLEKKEKAKLLSKVIFDLKVLRKSKTEIILLNTKDKKDALNFLISLGASTEQGKTAVNS